MKKESTKETLAFVKDIMSDDIKTAHQNKEVEAILNSSGGFKYTGKLNDNYGNPKTDYMTRVALMGEEELYQETKDKIWLSAYASNNYKSDYHWQCDFCYDLLSLRGKADVYSRAHKSVSESI